MNKKGFTLIELLAVIVVLAIIALIATPIVMNVIKKANEGAIERSAERYIDAVETAIATDRLENDLIADGEYNIVDGQLEGTTLDIEVSGDYPKSGTVVIENGQVVATGTSMIIGDYTVTIDDNGKSEAKKLMTLADCDLEEGTANTVGAKYTCNFGDRDRTFYILETGSNLISNSTLKSNEVALILEGNYDMETLSWCVSGSYNSCAADRLEAKLDDIVKNSWTKLKRSQIGIPSAVQIVVADGQNEDNYDDITTLTNEWLYSYPEYAEWSKEENPPIGYWTSTPGGVESSVMSIHAWFVFAGGTLPCHNVDDSELFGVRPIVILES